MRKLLIAVIIAFILLSCDTELMNTEIEINSLIGTWEYSGSDYIERFSFTDNEYTSYYKNLLFNQPETLGSGKYQKTNSIVVFNGESSFIDTENNNHTTTYTASADYIIDNNNLTLIFKHTGNIITYVRKTN